MRHQKYIRFSHDNYGIRGNVENQQPVWRFTPEGVASVPYVPIWIISGPTYYPIA